MTVLTMRKQVVGPSTTPFIVSLFNHAFALIPTPAGESIRVRVVGILGVVGRREGIAIEENAVRRPSPVVRAESKD